jgi:DNA-binding CsgD family transcriptional regulator
MTEGDEAAKLMACGIAIAAAIASGDHPFYKEYEAFLKHVIENNMGADVSSYAQLQLAIGFMGAGLPEMAAGWIKNGDFTNVYPAVKFEAIFLRIEYFRWQKKYESMLAAAQTTLSLLTSQYSQREFSFTEIQLRTRCAVACHYLGRVDEAKRWLLDAMDIAFPHGFTVPFADIITDLGGLLEQCMKQAYPEYRDKVIAQSRQIVNNWIAFHVRYLKDNTPLILSIREQEIANLAARRVPYAEIAKRFGLSPGTIKNTVQVIYSKLYVKNRDELFATLW